MIRDLEVGRTTGSSVLTRYLELRGTIERLQEQADALRSEITEALMDEPQSAFVHAGSKFVLRTRKKWQYTDDVDALESEVKKLRKEQTDLKRFQESSGIATLLEAKATLYVERAPEHEREVA